MSGSCHLDRVSNVEIGDECQIFIFAFFLNCGQVLQFGVHLRYYKGALTQKRSILVVCTTFRSDFHVGWKNHNKHSTFISSFDALAKWHEPHISLSVSCLSVKFIEKSNLVRSQSKHSHSRSCSISQHLGTIARHQQCCNYKKIKEITQKIWAYMV